jgi:hypothetical protein
MKENAMDLDALLRETRDVPDPGSDVLTTTRARLDAATAAAGLRVAALRRAHERRRRQRVVLSVLVGAAASAALVLAPTLDLPGRDPSGTAAAAQTLLLAADAAGEQTGDWPEAPYWHSVAEYRDPTRGDTVSRREVWMSRDGVSILVDQGVDDGKTIGLGPASFPAGARALTWDELDALPTDAAALERELRAGIGGTSKDDDDAMFVMVGDLLRESPASPALRRALWEVAARIPGIALVGAVEEAAGRPGVAVERGAQRYVLDPDDGRLLEESMDLGGSAFRYTHLEQGPAQAAPAAPPLPAGCTSYVRC